MKKPRELTPIDELIDVPALGRGGRTPTPSQIRAALPRGWALADHLRQILPRPEQDAGDPLNDWAAEKP